MVDDAAEGAERVGRNFVRRAESAERAGRETLREAESTLKEAGSDAQQALQDFGTKLRSQGEFLSRSASLATPCSLVHAYARPGG